MQTRIQETQTVADGARLAEPLDARPRVRVAAFGLGPHLQRIAEIVFRHARHNPYRFEVVPSREPDEFDLALVDMTVKGANDVARTLRGLPRARAVVTVGRRQDPTRVCDDLMLQRFAMNLLSVLNKTVESRAALSQSCRSPAAISSFGQTADALQTMLGRRARILLVDPSPTARRQLTLDMSSLGLDAQGVGSAAEAREALAQRPYEAVMLECDLPDGSGLTLVRDIRRDPALRSAATVVLTRRSGSWDKLMAAASACDAYLVKPASAPVLRDTLMRCLQRPLQAGRPARTPALRVGLSRLSVALRLQPQTQT